MKSVVYQESANNFTDTRQNIKGAQIATIEAFGMSPPSGGGDFVGQLGSATTAAGESLLYVYNGVEWKLVGQSGTANIPDEVVMEDRKNNFTEVDQRIEDCQITYIDTGTRSIANVAIKGPGHIYVYDSTPPKMYMSFDGNEWTQLQTENDKSDGDVKLTAANNFTNPAQSIMGRNIVNIIKTTLPADTSGITPTREGELYIQLAEGTSDRKARMWISNNAGGWKWEPLTHIYELPRTVVQTSKVNNFEATEQTIAGHQIMSFIDGGDQTPGQSGLRPDYDGQFYLATHTNTQGDKDVGIWVAEGNSWLPIREDINLATIARTDKSNRFTHPEQLLGEGGGNARWLSGNRVKFSGHSPLADQHWRVQNVGEITVYENTAVIPKEISVWMGVTKNPSDTSNAGEWAMIWSSKTGAIDEYAKLNQSNVFAPMQYISNGAKNHLINVGHEGGAGSPKKTLVPMAPGDTYTQSYSHPSLGETRNIWIAAIEGDTESWKRVLCEDDKDVVLTSNKNHFQNRNQFLGLEADTKRDRIMGARLNNTTGPAYNGVKPTMFGEVVVCEEWDPADPSNEDAKVVRAYLSVGDEFKSWLMIGERLKKDLVLNGQDSNN